MYIYLPLYAAKRPSTSRLPAATGEPVSQQTDAQRVTSAWQWWVYLQGCVVHHEARSLQAALPPVGYQTCVHIIQSISQLQHQDWFLPIGLASFKDMAHTIVSDGMLATLATLLGRYMCDRR